MTDEARPADTATEPNDAATDTTPTATAPPPEGGAEEQEPKEGKQEHKLHQTVEIQDVGPCKKHIKVTIPRNDITHLFDDKIKTLLKDQTTAVPGFRPGKAPRKIIEKRYHSQVATEVKAELLMASLEQLADEHELAPLAPPELDPFKLELPKQGDFVYEFDIEVRPEFDLPAYRGLKLKRPVKTFTDADVAAQLRRVLAPHAQIVPKPDGPAEVGDILVADLLVRDGDRVLNQMSEQMVRVDPTLAFKDGVAARFAEQVAGARAGESRVVDITLSTAVADASLRGKTVQATLTVKDVKTLRLPELTHEFVHRFGVHSEEQLRELIRAQLKRRLEYVQRQSAREQVLKLLAPSTEWQLPKDLLARQARKALSRKAMEMKADGVSEEEIQGRLRLMQQDILRSTAVSLMEHFVLQKVADLEEIDVSDEDLDDEIERLAEMNDESPRRLRARLEKEEMLDALAAEIVERKALDLILESAEHEEEPLEREPQAPVTTVVVQTVPGTMQDPTAAAAEAAAAEEQAAPASEPPAQS
jgi:trigger factor